MSLLPIADRPTLIRPVAAVHHAEWGGLMLDWSAQDALDELLEHAQSRGVDRSHFVGQTWLLVPDDGEQATWFGSVSLVATDALQFAPLTPWLCSLFVQKHCRGLGYASRLIKHALDSAESAGFEHVHVFTESARELFEHHGFRLLDQRVLFDRSVDLLRISL